MIHNKYMEIDFLYLGGHEDYLHQVYEPLRHSLERADNLAGELNGNLSYTGHRGETLKLGSQHLYHGNITIGFQYESEKPMPKLADQILPSLLETHVMPHFKTDRCTVLKNMHSRGYLIAMANEIAEEDEAVIRGAAEHGVPEAFTKALLSARPHGAR